MDLFPGSLAASKVLAAAVPVAKDQRAGEDRALIEIFLSRLITSLPVIGVSAAVIIAVKRIVLLLQNTSFLQSIPLKIIDLAALEPLQVEGIFLLVFLVSKVQTRLAVVRGCISWFEPSDGVGARMKVLHGVEDAANIRISECGVLLSMGELDGFLPPEFELIEDQIAQLLIAERDVREARDDWRHAVEQLQAAVVRVEHSRLFVVDIQQKLGDRYGLVSAGVCVLRHVIVDNAVQERFAHARAGAELQTGGSIYDVFVSPEAEAGTQTKRKQT